MWLFMNKNVVYQHKYFTEALFVELVPVILSQSGVTFLTH